MKKIKRIGPKMKALTHYCNGMSIPSAARVVGPNGSVKFTYDICKRAEKAGLIEFRPRTPEERKANPHARGVRIVVLRDAW